MSRKAKPKKYMLGGEFHEIVKDVLLTHPELEVDVVAEAIEKRIKEKFHIFRINKLMTGD